MTRLIILTALLGCSTDRIHDIEQLDGDLNNGATVYDDSCAGCHGASGEGGVGPSMDGVMPNHSDTLFLEVVLSGLGDEMPSFGALEDQQLADLLSWLRNEFGEYSGEDHEQDDGDEH